MSRGLPKVGQVLCRRMSQSTGAMFTHPQLVALRSLTDEQRAALMTRLKSDVVGLTRDRAHRQAEIIRRCVLGSEPREVVCAEFGISSQQFYTDRLAGLKRAMRWVEYRSVTRTPNTLRAPLENVVVARSLFEAGESVRAASVLDQVPDDVHTGVALLERFALEFDIDADTGRDRQAATRRRLERLMSSESPSAVPFVRAAIAWNEVRFIAGSGDGTSLERALKPALEALRVCQSLDARTSGVRARLLSSIAVSQLEAGQSHQAQESIETAVRIVGEREDMPLGLRAIVHANRAYVCSATPQTLFRATEQREAALALARTNALPRAIWVGLHLRISDRIWRGEHRAALDDARELHGMVQFSDSLPWRDIAATRVSNALSALGRFDEAENAIAARGHDGSAFGFALQQCALTFRRGRYAQVLREAAAIRATWPDRPKRYHANGLLYSADAAYRLGDLRRARAEIDDAVAITDAQPPALYIAQRIYALAHRITGRSRYRDAANDLQRTFEAAATTATEGTGPGVLTPRQRQVAELAAAGATNREIAVRLGLSARTVANHLASAFAELGVRARWQLPASL